MISRNLLLPLLALLTWVGCGGDEDLSQAPVRHSVRDSAGVEVVSVDGLDNPDAVWRIDPAPEVVIGELEGPPTQQLFNVIDATVLPDGRIAVANSGTFELRFFGPQGNYLASVGGEGDGPGEFRSLSAVDVVEGDSIYVWDQRAMRVSVLNVHGNFVRSFQLTAPEERSFPRYWTSLLDGSCLVRVSDIAEGMPEDRSVGHGSTTLMHYTSRGQPVDTIVSVPNEPMYRLIHSGGRGISFFPLPFAPGGTWASEGMKVYEGTGETYEIRTYDQTGHLVRILRAPVAPAHVTDALLESYAAERLAASSEDKEWQELLRAAYADMPHPDVARIFDALAADATGRLWVRRTPMPRDSLRHWDVFDPEGRYVAQAVIPSELRVREIGADYVLALRRNDLDVEQVVLFRFRKP